jgi:protein-tyrosine kinase
MSRFFRALEQAEREAAQRRGQTAAGAGPAALSTPATNEKPHASTTAANRSPEPQPEAPRSHAPAIQAPEPAPAATAVGRSSDTTRGRAGHVDSPGAHRWNGGASQVDPHFVSLVDPTAFEAEQYRSLRHFIELAHRDRGLVVLAISSPAVGDGKTTTVINLAGALAQDPGARVLLVDADLRRPGIGNVLPPEEPDVVAPPGLIDAILDDRLRLDDVVQARPFNLSILTAGGTPDAPYELLKSPRLAALLDEARSRYDYVILDAPPLVPFPDCRILERLLDGLLIVVGANRTPRKLLEESLDVIDPAKVLGLVFNADDRPRPGYYGNRGGRWIPLLRRNGARGLAEDTGRPGLEG